MKESNPGHQNLGSDVKNQVHDMLYKFTMKKLEQFKATPELAFLFANWIETSASDELADKHREAMNDLLQSCQKTLNCIFRDN